MRNLILSTFMCAGLLLTATGKAQTQTSGTRNLADLFDGERAFVDLVKQVEAGPRLPDHPGLDFTRNLIRTTLTENGFDVHTQPFETTSPLLMKQVKGENIFGVYPKGATVKYIISAHYDTRPYADMDPDPSKRMLPVPGANDGASGVAALLELSRAIPQATPPHGIALVFFDVEDHGGKGDEMGFCLGSRYFASNLPTQVQGFQHGINLDMIARDGMTLPMEGYSLSKAPRLTFDLWNAGSSLHPDVWLKTRGPSIYDDHMPFLALKMSYIDVIDFEYAPWHTTGDTPDKCSAQSLDIVGDTILQFIQN